VAAHQIAINIASLTFMVPFGVSSAVDAGGSARMGRRHRQRPFHV